MAKFQIIDLFQRASVTTATNGTDTTSVPSSAIVEADSMDCVRDGGVIFYTGGAKVGIASLGAGFLVQKVDG